MKTLIISIILIVAFSSNSLFANGKNTIKSKSGKTEISLKIKSHPYSFLKKIYKPNPIA